MKKTRLLVVLSSLAMWLVLPGISRAQVTLYSSISSDEFQNYWLTFGCNAPVCESYDAAGEGPLTGVTGPIYTSVAAAFTPPGNSTDKYKLAQIDLVVIPWIGDFDNPFPYTIQLAEDLGGQPGTVLESWSAVTSDFSPPSIGFNTTVKDTLGIAVTGGRQYWVVLAGNPLGSYISYCNFYSCPDVDLWLGSASVTGPTLVNNGLGWMPAPEDALTVPAPPGITQQFDVKGYQILPAAPVVGLGWNQIARLIIAGPVTPAPGTPVEASVGLVDLNGNAIGPAPTTVTVNPGQVVSVDFPANAFVTAGQRAEVVPVITPLPNPNGGLPSGSIQASVEVRDAILGIGTIFIPVPTFPADSNAPTLTAQDLAGGQTMRLTARAIPVDPCIGTLSFADSNGNPVGTSQAINLQPGTAAYVDLNADSLGLRVGQTINVQPIVTLTPVIGSAAAPPSVCQATVEVFDHLTLRTETYQTAAVQSPSAQ